MLGVGMRMARILAYIATLLLACATVISAAAQQQVPVEFRLIDETHLSGVTVSVASGEGGLTMLSGEARPGGITAFTHKEPATWPTEVRFVITIPARAANGDLIMDIETSTVELAFSVRPVFDLQVITIPLKLIESVTTSNITKILRMGDDKALEKMVLLQQAFNVWSSLNQNGSLTKDIAREWMDTIFRSVTIRSRALAVPFKYDRSALAAVAAAFSDDRERIAYQFDTRVTELADLFWKIPGQFRMVVDTGRCDVAMQGALHVVKQHFTDPEAATRARIGPPREQIERMVRLMKPQCEEYDPDSILKVFDDEEARQ